MCRFIMHRVGEIRVSADSRVRHGGAVVWRQTLRLFDADGNRLGEIVLHLDAPDTALPVGRSAALLGV